MYGLVNKALRDFVCERFSPERWEAIRREAGVEGTAFITNKSYPDEMTYRLVGAASRSLGMSVEEVLEGFGEYWVLFTGRQGYGNLLQSSGGDWREFLLHLPNLHTRLELIFPELKPPSFDCVLQDGQQVLVRYRSHRPGLTPMVVGLLRGVGRMYGASLAIAHSPDGEGVQFVVQAKPDGAKPDRKA
jgi:hypothetical protein